MGDTQVLLSKISALRQRLEQAQGLARDADSAAAALVHMAPGEPVALRDTFAALERKVADGARQTAMIAETFRPSAADGPLPVRLTARAIRLLQQGRRLLDP